MDFPEGPNTKAPRGFRFSLWGLSSILGLPKSEFLSKRNNELRNLDTLIVGLGICMQAKSKIVWEEVEEPHFSKEGWGFLFFLRKGGKDEPRRDRRRKSGGAGGAAKPHLRGERDHQRGDAAGFSEIGSGPE